MTRKRHSGWLNETGMYRNPGAPVATLIEAVKADELDKALLAAKKERAAVMRKR